MTHPHDQVHMSELKGALVVRSLRDKLRVSVRSSEKHFGIGLKGFEQANSLTCDELILLLHTICD